MIAWLLNFMAGLAFISLATIGFIIVAIHFLRWLNSNTSASFDLVGQSAEAEITYLQDQAVGDMFDHARQTAMQRQVGDAA